MSVRKVRGFTIFEIMAVLAVVAIVSAFAIPGIKSLQVNSGLRSLNDDVINSLSLARTTSITQRRNVIWMRTSAPDAWEVRLGDTTGTVLAQGLINQAGVTLELVPSVGTTPLTQMRFEPTGVVKREDTVTATDVEFRICSSQANNEVGRSVNLSRLGRLAADKHATSATCGS